jgi:cobalamin biosynthesis Mg chelatase CobN
MDYDKIKEQLISDPEVRDRIARRAYEIYVERRGRPGHPAEDWLRAEGEVLPGLMEEILRKNREVIDAHDSSNPTMRRAAEHMDEELRAEGADGSSSRAVGQMAEQARESLWTKTGSDDLVPDAKAVTEKISGAPTPAAAPRPKSGAKPDGKTAPKGSGAKGRASTGVKSSGTKSATKGAAGSAAKGSGKGTAKPAAKKGSAKSPAKSTSSKGAPKKSQGKK